jgi:hypothetical protein
MKDALYNLTVANAYSNDIDIKLNVVGAMHRLAMDEQVKRPFVLAG